jgi:hypothetical protein
MKKEEDEGIEFALIHLIGFILFYCFFQDFFLVFSCLSELVFRLFSFSYNLIKIFLKS